MKRFLLFLIVIGLKAQPYISPFAAPPFSTLPSTCYIGQMVTNSVIGAVYECTGSNTWQPMVKGPGSATTGNIPTFVDAQGSILANGYPTTTAGPAGGGAATTGVVLTGSSGYLDPSLLNGTIFLVANESTGGTVITHLAKIDSSGKAVQALITDTTVPVYICVEGCGTTGFAVLRATGSDTCAFDSGGSTAGHFVVASTITAGDCHDIGASYPSSGWVIGQVSSTGTVILMQGDSASSSGGSGVVSINFTTPSNGFTFTSNTGLPINTGNPTGTVTLGFSTESAGVVFAGPCTGAAASPTWRALCYNDIPAAVNTVSFSTTPNFDLSLGGIQTITLTGNVTSSTISNGIAGKSYSFIICQDGTGGRTFVWPAGFHGTMTIGSLASDCSDQKFDALNSTTLYTPGPGMINQ